MSRAPLKIEPARRMEFVVFETQEYSCRMCE